MFFVLGNAEGPDPTDSNLAFVLIAMVIIAAVGLFAAIPVITARRRGLAQSEGIAALIVLWGLLSAGSILYTVHAQMAYSKEYTMRIMQNYDARDQSDRPNMPWVIWGFLAAAYGGAAFWSATAKSEAARGFPITPVDSERETKG